MYQDGQGWVPDEIIVDAPVFVLGQNPGEDEARTSKPFVGKTGTEMMCRYFPLAQLERGVNVSIGNALRCRWNGGNTLPPEKTLKAALAHCTREHLHVPPSVRVMVAQGALAARVVGCPGRISDWRGHTWEWTPPKTCTSYCFEACDGSCTSVVHVVGSLHLADLYRDARMIRATESDWRKVPLILKGVYPKPMPPRWCYYGHYDRRLNDWFEDARKAPYVAIDTEFNPDTKVCWLIGLGYPGSSVLQAMGDGLNEEFSKRLTHLVKNVPVVFQNAVADIPVIEAAFGIRYKDYWRIDDTMLLHAVLYSEWPHDLEFLASIYGQYPKMKHLMKTEPLVYNAGDVLATIDVWEGLKRDCHDDPQSEAVYHTQSRPLVPIILDARRHGIRVNQLRVGPAIVEYEATKQTALSCAREAAPSPPPKLTKTGKLAKHQPAFNVGSSAQVARYCYAVQGYPIQRHKDTKQATVNEDAIATLRALYPHDVVLEARARYMEAQQVLSHYLRPLEGKDRIYPEIKIHTQATGRWSITDPPLQQLPKHLRDILIPDEGEVWLHWDFSQIEYRLLAALANDIPALHAFAQGRDLHAENSALIFGKQDNGFREFTKRFTYRLHYRGDARSAGDIPGAKSLNLDAARLVLASRKYLSGHPALPAYWRRQDEQIRRTGEIRTFLGRKRRGMGKPGPAMLRELGNHPLQGGVADVLNLTLIAIMARFPWCRFVWQMHDSAYIACPEGKVDDTLPGVIEIVNRDWQVGERTVTFPAEVEIIR